MEIKKSENYMKTLTVLNMLMYRHLELNFIKKYDCIFYIKGVVFGVYFE